MTVALGVLPVGAGSRLVLQGLHGRTLLTRAIEELSAAADRVIVLVEPSLGAAVRDAMARDDPGVPVVDVDPVLGPLGDVGVELRAAVRVVLHDARCPLLPSAEIARVLAIGGVAAVGVRLVTDTVKTVATSAAGAGSPGNARITGTLDREAYRAVCSPLVMASAAVDILDAGPGPAWWTADFWDLVPTLRRHVPVGLVDVSWLGSRVDDEAGLGLLAAH